MRDITHRGRVPIDLRAQGDPPRLCDITHAETTLGLNSQEQHAPFLHHLTHTHTHTHTHPPTHTHTQRHTETHTQTHTPISFDFSYQTHNLAFVLISRS